MSSAWTGPQPNSRVVGSVEVHHRRATTDGRPVAAHREVGPGAALGHGHLRRDRVVARPVDHELAVGAGRDRSEGVGAVGGRDGRRVEGPEALERQGDRHARYRLTGRGVHDGAVEHALLDLVRRALEARGRLDVVATERSGVEAHAPRGEGVPDLLVVLALEVGRVGDEQRVAHVEERRVERRELHGPGDQALGDAGTDLVAQRPEGLGPRSRRRRAPRRHRRSWRSRRRCSRPCGR